VISSDSKRNRAAVAKVAFAASVGNAVELYDFMVYGTAAAVVFSKIFFPAHDPVVGTLLAFATLGAGFLVRPLGGIVIGHFGDRVGRKSMLVLTLTGAGVSTALIGVLPSYSSIGIWAPILLVFLRLVQGFFLGGEQGGSMLMAVEHAPSGRRVWYGSWTLLGAPFGIVLSNATFSLVSTISGNALLTWGWRLPFLFSIVLVGVGLYVRLGVAESPEFARLRKDRETTRLPVLEVLRTGWRPVLLAAGVTAGWNSFAYMPITFVLSYTTTTLHLPRGVPLAGNLIGGTADAAGILLFAWWAQRRGSQGVMLAGAAFIALFAFPLFWLIDTRNPALVILALSLGFFGSAAIYAPMAAVFANLFDARVRYSGVSLSFQIGTAIGGGLAPLVGQALVNASGKAWPVSLYLAVGGVISLISVVALWPAKPVVTPSPALEPAG
jgi:MFS family permease